MANLENKKTLGLALSIMVFYACLVDAHGAQVTSPQEPSSQDTKASSGGTAINTSRDLTINYRDPQVQRLLRLIDRHAVDVRDWTDRLERANEQLRNEQAKAIAGVLNAAVQPNASPTVTAAKKALQAGQSNPAETYYREQEDLSVKTGRENLGEAAEAARRQGSLAFLYDTQKALDAYLRAAEYEPDNVWNWIQLGDLQARERNTMGAMESYRRGLRIAESRTVDNPDNTDWQRDLAVSHEKIGDMLLRQDNIQQAVESYRRSLVIAETLSARDANNALWQRDLAVSHERIGFTQAMQGNMGQAIDSYRRSLAIAEKLAAGDPNNPERQRDLWVSYKRFGDMVAMQGLDAGQAIESYRRGLAVAEILAKSDPGNTEWQIDLSHSLEWVGFMLAKQGNSVQAIQSYRRSLALREKLVARDPNNTQPQIQVVFSIINLTSLVPPLSAREAEALITRGISILKKLRVQGKVSPMLQDWETRLTDRLKLLKSK